LIVSDKVITQTDFIFLIKLWIQRYFGSNSRKGQIYRIIGL